MVFKKNNPGCPCCPCPCYYFEGSGKDSFGNKRLTETGTLYSTTASQDAQSAKFTGSSYFQREKHSCFSPYGHTTWTISFDIKIVTLPTLAGAPATYGNTMGVVTRATVDGVIPVATFAGEWGIFYEHRETGGTLFFGLKTDNTEHIFPDKGGGAVGEAINDVGGSGVNGFYNASWTVGPESASVVTVGASTTENTYIGNLVYGDDDLLVGNNTEGLKLGEDFYGRDGGEILIDNLCFSVT
jgi:hypothetical protein